MTVFVKNMNFKVTDKELWDFFSDCGTVTKVAVKRDDKGHSKVTCRQCLSHKTS